ncbi:efflux RND transporter periplasmic adaptor subunit [Hymenobacter sp.]|uniref:efflux RND transporter periplasmic adaptor subunit n=1 Tax=Hymenobacter sp. TaxID=1898978 RepID=UPI002ED7A3CB
MKNHLSLSLCLVLALPAATLSSCQQNEAAQKITVEPVRVQVRPINGLPNAEQIEYSGTVEAKTSTMLSFSVSGTVRRVLVEQGQRVRKGQLLAVVDLDAIDDNYQSAKARQRQAQDMYNRLKPVVENGSLPEVRLVEARENLAQANSAVHAAGVSVNDTRLVAPHDGVIGQRMVEPGQVAAPGSPVLQLLDMREVYVKVAVPEGEISGVKLGQPAQVTVRSRDAEALKGKVDEIGVIADPMARTYTVKVALPRTSHGLLPGMVTTVNLRTAGTISQASLVVPNQALRVDESGRSFVYVTTDGNKAARRQVSTGALNRNGITITAGLTPQDQLIVSGYQRLSDGAAITVVR